MKQSIIWAVWWHIPLGMLPRPELQGLFCVPVSVSVCVHCIKLYSQAPPWTDLPLKVPCSQMINEKDAGMLEAACSAAGARAHVPPTHLPQRPQMFWVCNDNCTGEHLLQV